MACLLENQAKELLREASSMAAGDVEGFAAVAFPIVRRVFGGLIANDLISVQPMSLPSGLIFFMDFTHEDGRLGSAAGESLYGGRAVASQIIDGVEPEGGFYNLGGAKSAAHTKIVGTSTNVAGTARAASAATVKAEDFDPDLQGQERLQFALSLSGDTLSQVDPGVPQALDIEFTDLNANDQEGTHCVRVKLLDGTEALVQESGGGNYGVAASGVGADGDLACVIVRPVKRLTKFTHSSANGLKTVTGLERVVFQPVSILDLGKTVTELGGAMAANAGAGPATRAEIAALGEDVLRKAIADAVATPVALTAAQADGILTGTNGKVDIHCPMRDEIQTASSSLGALVGADVWGLEEPDPGTGNEGSGVGKNTIAEIDIKVDSVAVTAQTKKLKAKWSPELGQDLNAYHNLDAEVELTGILSEQIALEIDQEILGELVRGSTAGVRYWSRAPGLFVDASGAQVGAQAAAPDFTGTVSEWYETLIETINDVSAQIHRKTLRGGANFIVCGPEVANILEFTSGFRANVTHDADKGQIGALKAGSLSKKFEVYVDPYFLRNVILVGRKGSSFLESGYVYAPYVPLQVTPTIFGTEDFVPRKGVMTRYAKKMVRPDMYGLVVVRGLLGEEG